MTEPKWETITREERFFTCILFHDMLEDPEPLCILLQDKLKLPTKQMISDIGYEVCFFRDAYHAKPKLIKNRQNGQNGQLQLEKQTFDLVLWLSDRSMIIIEAKAQQGFNIDQIKMLHESRKLISKLSVPPIPIKKIFLVGLCSSHYTPKPSTRDQFQSIITWDDIARIYPSRNTCKAAYMCADSLYGK